MEAMRRVYTLVLYLLLPLALLRLYWRSLSAPAYRQRIGQRFGVVPELRKDGLWVHAVSVGEVQAITPLIQRLLKNQPDLPVIVTTTTPTGSSRLNDLLGDQVQHVYAPYDVPSVVSRFLDACRPRLAVFVETEVWPNILHACKLRGIPSLLANARLSERSEKSYARLGRFSRETFANFSMVAAQSELDGERFSRLGVDARQLEVTGSIKFDARLPPSLQEESAVIKRIWGEDRPVWVAASTHEGEDEQVLAAHQKVLEKIPDALLVLVPRHPERFQRVGALVERMGLEQVRRSEQQICSPQAQVFLGDSMGELPMFFSAVDVAFVGDSLVSHGGHNLLEPASTGVPVLTGPHVFNFSLIADLLIKEGAARQVADSEELAQALVSLLSDASLRAGLDRLELLVDGFLS